MTRQAWADRQVRKLETGLQPVVIMVVTSLLWLLTFAAAKGVSHNPAASATTRAGLVALGVLGFAVWIVFVARRILAQDEFTQRIHLVSIAASAGVVAVLLMAGELLQGAGFLGPVPLDGLWMVMGGVWWISIMVSTWYYR